MITRLRKLGGLAALVLGVGMAGSGGAAATVATSGHGVLIPARAGQVLPVKNADTSSLNWSGYAVVGQAGHPITAVTQNWVVPTVSSVPAGFSSTWGGIGGGKNHHHSPAPAPGGQAPGPPPPGREPPGAAHPTP